MSFQRLRSRIPGIILLLVLSGVPVSAEEIPVISLDDCLKALAATGPGPRSADLTLGSAQAVFDQARAREGLSLGGTAGYARQGTSSPSAATDTVKGALNLTGPGASLGLTGDQPLTAQQGTQSGTYALTGSQVLWDGYLGGLPGAQVKVAESGFRAARITKDAAVKTGILQTSQAYYALLGDQKTLLVRQATLDMAQTNLGQEKALHQAQRATDLDVLQMDVAFRQAQLDLNKALDQTAADRKALSITLGWPRDKLYRVQDAAMPAPAAKDAVEAVRLAWDHRADLQVLGETVGSAQVNLRIQQAGTSPVVTLSGSLGVVKDWVAGTTSQTYSIGADVSLPPVLDGGLSGAQVRQAEAQLEASNLQLDQTRQQAALTVETGWLTIQETGDQLDLAGTNVSQAQGQYDLDKTKLSLGLATTTDVLTSFAALTTAQVSLEQAKTAHVLAILQFNNDLGL